MRQQEYAKEIVAFVTAGILMLPGVAAAGAVLPDSGFTSNTFARNDDGSILVTLPFSIDFYGISTSSVYLNNNGNITFSAPLGTFTPFAITSGSTPMLAPFFADVDTRSAGLPVKYGASTVDGHSAFGFNWVDVDYYSSSPLHANHNSFQLVLIDRSDTGAGNFDFEFNYDSILWETGQASGGNFSGRGGDCARAGYTNGTGTYLELDGSGDCGAFLNGGAHALNASSLNSDVDGRYLFSVRNGSVVTTTVPEPGTFALLAGGVVAAALRRRRAK